MESLPEVRKKAKAYIAHANPKKAIETLMQFLDDNHLDSPNNFIGFQARFNGINDLRVNGILSLEEGQRQLNSFNRDFLEYLERLEEEDLEKLEEGQNEDEVVPSLIILGGDKDKVKETQELYKVLGFDKVDILELEAGWQKTDFSPYTLIVFDNRDIPFCPNENFKKGLDAPLIELVDRRIQNMEEFLNTNKGKFIIHFGDILYWVRDWRDRVQAANSRFSLHSRTKEAINFIRAYKVGNINS